ncbi:hypothetical protein D3C81_2266060 [compost metagenome]
MRNPRDLSHTGNTGESAADQHDDDDMLLDMNPRIAGSRRVGPDQAQLIPPAGEFDH